MVRKQKAKAKKQNKKAKQKVVPSKPGDNTEQIDDNTNGSLDSNIPGTSGDASADSNAEIGVELQTDMGRGSDESDQDTSDVDSEELERQNQELEELDRQIQEKQEKRSNKEKRERKQILANMRRAAEQKRRELQGLESESEGESPTKRQKLDSVKSKKSKDRKGVKNKGKVPTVHKNSQLKTLASNKQAKNHSRSEDTSESLDSSEDEFAATIKRARKSSKKSETMRVKNKSINISKTAKKQCGHNESSPESEDSSSDSTMSTSTQSSGESRTSDSNGERRN